MGIGCVAVRENATGEDDGSDDKCPPQVTNLEEPVGNDPNDPNNM